MGRARLFRHRSRSHDCLRESINPVVSNRGGVEMVSLDPLESGGRQRRAHSINGKMESYVSSATTSATSAMIGQGMRLSTFVQNTPLEKYKRVLALGIVVFYFSLGVVMYSFVLEDWSVGDALYFTAVTVTTVGYGDLYPTSDGSRAFTICFILIGLALVGSVISRFVSELLDKQADLIMKRMDDAAPKKQHSARIAHSIGMVILCVLVGTLFVMHNEEWTFIGALYWSFVTTTTVGYGDMALDSVSSRNFSIGYILISTMVVASCLGVFAAVGLEKKQEQRRELLLRQTFNLEMLMEMDEDDGDGRVDAGEFLATYLISLGYVSKEDTAPILKRFRELDMDGSGFLDQADIKLIVEQERSTTSSNRSSRPGSARSTRSTAGGTPGGGGRWWGRGETGGGGGGGMAGFPPPHTSDDAYAAAAAAATAAEQGGGGGRGRGGGGGGGS